MLLLWANITQ